MPTTNLISAPIQRSGRSVLELHESFSFAGSMTRQSAELVLRSGDIIVMSGPTQRFWHHQIPKTSKPVDQRINLTFRRIRR